MNRLKTVKFTSINVGSSFQIPDFIQGFERPMLKLGENTYADVMTKQVFWANENFSVNVIQTDDEVQEAK